MVKPKDKTISASQKKLVSYFYKREPNLSDKDVTALLSDVKRFVNVVRKIRTEPQAKIVYKDEKENGKTVKSKIFNTDLEELKKVMEPGEAINIKTFRKLYESLAKKKNG